MSDEVTESFFLFLLSFFFFIAMYRAYLVMTWGEWHAYFYMDRGNTVRSNPDSTKPYDPPRSQQSIVRRYICRTRKTGARSHATGVVVEQDSGSMGSFSAPKLSLSLSLVVPTKNITLVEVVS